MGLNVEEARKLAESEALLQMGSIIKIGQSALMDEYEEAENCWFFFRDRRVFGRPEDLLKWDWAYAVSKKGLVSLIHDFYDDKEKLDEYLCSYSEYLKSRRE